MSEPRAPAFKRLSSVSLGVWGLLAANVAALGLAPIASPRLIIVLLAAALGSFALVCPIASVRVCAGYTVAFVAFAQLRAIENDAGLPVHFDYVAALDKGLFLGTSPTVWLQEHLYDVGAVDALDVACAVVYLSYFLVPHVAALLLWQRGRPQFLRYVFALFATAYASLVVALFAPTAPPWLAGENGVLPYVARVVKDVINGVDRSAYGQGHHVVGANDVAAMPSVHMAMTVLVAAAAWQGGRRVRLAVVAYALAMAFSLVYAGEHYVVDVAAGTILALVAWRVASRIPARLSARLGLTATPAGS